MVRVEYAARTEVFRAASLRARPIIAALDQYRSKTGSYPAALDALVPDYLAEIPHTNVAAYPKFDYAVPPQPETPAATYELFIETPVGGINWDVFVFRPEKVYPEYMHGGYVERIDDWAYVHE